MITRKRQQNDDDYDATTMDMARNVVYVLVLAAVVVWLGPPALGIDVGGVKSCGDLSDMRPLELCSAPDGALYRANGDATGVEPVDTDGKENLADTIIGATAKAQTVMAAVMEALKYGLLVAAVASIAVMRVRPRPT